MKKKDFFPDTPKCAYTMCHEMAGDVHELAGGMCSKKGKGDRDLCIKNHIQLPLCRNHHLYMEKSKKYLFDKGCEIMGLDSDFTRLAINTVDVDMLREVQKQAIKFYRERYGLIL